MFINTEFPTCLAIGAVGTPEWSTAVAENQGGFEQRNQIWTYSKHAYDVSTAVRSREEYALAIDHFNEMRGRAHYFPFQDFLDFEVESWQGVVLLVSAGVYQLAKRYGTLNPYYRKITRPVGAVLSAGTLGALGLVTGGDGDTTWTGEFRVPVRYGMDRLPGQVVNSNGTTLFVQASSITLMEVRE